MLHWAYTAFSDEDLTLNPFTLSAVREAGGGNIYKCDSDFYISLFSITSSQAKYYDLLCQTGFVAS